MQGRIQNVEDKNIGIISMPAASDQAAGKPPA
jgi:hypothetical protein